MPRLMRQTNCDVEFAGSPSAALDRGGVRALVREIGVLPALRITSAEDALFVAEALAEAGIPIVEIAANFAGAAQLISEVARRAPRTVVGAGSVIRPTDAQACIEAGARFISTTTLAPEINELVWKKGIAVIAGAFTPTEIVAAWKVGADFVKVFPCNAAGGAAYIRSVSAALPEVPLVAAGGVTQQTALGFVAAGATAIGVGQALVPAEAIRMRQSGQIQELARRFVSHVDNGRIEAAGRGYSTAMPN